MAREATTAMASLVTTSGVAVAEDKLLVRLLEEG